MEETFVDVNGVPTRIRTWGKTLDENFDDKKDLILFLSGNPGVTGFYITFLSTLFKFLHGETPIWAIGQAGHDEPDDDTMKLPPLKSNQHLYDLKGQINHKVEFIRKYIPPNVKIHLVGHSIGACISLHLLKFDDINKRFSHCYLLFPALEYMSETPNGKLYISLLQRFFGIIYRLLQIFSFFPFVLQTLIISIVCLFRSFPQIFVPYIMMVSRPSVMSKIVHMTDDEMEKLQAPDYDLIKQNQDRLSFIYSTLDKWAPHSHYERLIENVPNVDAKSTDKFEHTFVSKTSCEMGVLLGEWMQQQNTRSS